MKPPTHPLPRTRTARRLEQAARPLKEEIRMLRFVIQRVMTLADEERTLDEMLADPHLREADLLSHTLELFSRSPAPARAGAGRPGSTHVFTAHAEMEGRGWVDWFEQLLTTLRQSGAEFFTLRELAEAVVGTGAGAPARVVAGHLPGRAGTVSCQDGYLAD